LIVVDAHTGIVSAGSAAANRGYVKIGPRGNRLEDGALRTCVNSSLSNVSQRDVLDAQFIQGSNLESELGSTVRSNKVAMSSNNGRQ
jgi:hypothetical protein